MSLCVYQPEHRNTSLKKLTVHERLMSKWSNSAKFTAQLNATHVQRSTSYRVKLNKVTKSFSNESYFCMFLFYDQTAKVCIKRRGRRHVLCCLLTTQHLFSFISYKMSLFSLWRTLWPTFANMRGSPQTFPSCKSITCSRRCSGFSCRWSTGIC